jgi:hypothetical protein
VAASDRDGRAVIHKEIPLDHSGFIPRWLTAWIKRKWEEFGLDQVTLSTYEFLISYPDAANPNKIHLYDDQNKKVRLPLLTSFCKNKWNCLLIVIYLMILHTERA